MKCHEARKWISPYLDSELGQTKTFEVSEHLQRCNDCAARFDAERRVEAMIRDRLDPEPMPEALWDALQRIPVTGRGSRWLHWGGRLAMAAVLAFAATVLWPDAVVTTAQPPMVAEFITTAPHNKAFAPDEAFAASSDYATLAESVVSTLRREFGLVLPDPGSALPHGHVSLELVSAEVRHDAGGREYVEVRLNCCGEPVLLAFARDVGGVLPSLFDGLPRNGGLPEQQVGGVRVASRAIAGGVAVVASRHPISHILGGLREAGA